MPQFARDGLNAVYDYTEGIMDLIQPSADVLDYLGKPEMIFFGPDEGTAASVRVMVESRAGAKSWTTIGVHTNIIEASWQAIVDGVEYGLLQIAENNLPKQEEETDDLVES